MKVSILTGGWDPHYALGLLRALKNRELEIDFIANEEMKHDGALMGSNNVRYLDFRGNQDAKAALREKVVRVLKYYSRLIRYAGTSESQLFHILWMSKFILFEGTLLNWYFRLMGKKIVYTAHNINAWERDGGDRKWKRSFLKRMYAGMDHIFVHTEEMKKKLGDEYAVPEEKVTVVPFGINNVIPRSALDGQRARQTLGLGTEHRIVLFFGNIALYKGVDILIDAAGILKERIPNLKIVIAGMVGKKCPEHWKEIEKRIQEKQLESSVLLRTEYIPDGEVEVFFKAADVAVLPYRRIFQSGVLALAYSFGLPVIVSDVGPLSGEVIEGETGFVCQPENPIDLAARIEIFFSSSLFSNPDTREKIIDYGRKRNSWDEVGNRTFKVYENLLKAFTADEARCTEQRVAIQTSCAPGHFQNTKQNESKL